MTRKKTPRLQLQSNSALTEKWVLPLIFTHLIYIPPPPHPQTHKTWPPPQKCKSTSCILMMIGVFVDVQASIKFSGKSCLSARKLSALPCTNMNRREQSTELPLLCTLPPTPTPTSPSSVHINNLQEQLLFKTLPPTPSTQPPTHPHTHTHTHTHTHFTLNCLNNNQPYLPLSNFGSHNNYSHIFDQAQAKKH